MSISQIQIKNILELIAKSYFVNGVAPTGDDFHPFLNEYFSKNVPGNPIIFDLNVFARNIVSDPELLNDFMAMVIVNIDTLYEACAQQIDDLMILNTVLRTHLQRLKIKRTMLEQKIDDFLLGIFNSDGYFYSFSDDLSFTDFIDFNLTSAFVDVDSGLASLPAISSMSKRLNLAALSEPVVTARNSSGNTVPILIKTSFENAFDGMTNTAWFFDVKVQYPEPITVDIQMMLPTQFTSGAVSRIDLTPFGITPVQCGINATFVAEDSTTYTKPFCSYVKRSTEKISFIGDGIKDQINKFNLQLSKNEFDTVEQINGATVYVYTFGFKEIMILEQVYDSFATLVTEPFGIASELTSETAIDAVSLVTQDFIPTNTSIRYYIAQDIPNGGSSISNFDWKEITPISISQDSTKSVVRFNGSTVSSKMIRKNTRTASDLKLIDQNSTSSDLTKRNPTPAYIAGLDVYRIAGFTDEFLSNTLSLEEGINSTRIFYTDLDENAITNGFAFWKQKFDDPTSYSTTYGEIDSGHEFFYGADIGEDNKSIYVETFLNVEKELPVILKECRKSDTNSRIWDVRIFLNGREIANMPVGIDKITVPWKLKQGKNHIVAMINIPPTTLVNQYPYIGTINLMSDDDMSNFGVVKLDNWTYVDLYKFKNNQVNTANTFTIYNGEIITRKKPTNNFKISYKKPTLTAPTALRLRADFARSSKDVKSTPILDSYRVRFSYGDTV